MSNMQMTFCLFCLYEKCRIANDNKQRLLRREERMMQQQDDDDDDDEERC